MTKYHYTRGSDVVRGGMFLELVETGTSRQVAEVFYSDVTHEMSVTYWEDDVPAEVLEAFVDEATKVLPPSG